MNAKFAQFEREAVQVIESLASDEDCADFVGLLAKLRCRLQMRIAGQSRAVAPQQRGNRVLNVQEAAEKLGVSKDFLYRHPKELACCEIRTGDKLGYSELALEKYIAKNTGRAV